METLVRERYRNFLDIVDLLQHHLYRPLGGRNLMDELQVNAEDDLPWFCDDPSALIHGWLDDVILLDSGPSNALRVRPF